MIDLYIGYENIVGHGKRPPFMAEILPIRRKTLCNQSINRWKTSLNAAMCLHHYNTFEMFVDKTSLLNVQ